MEKKPPLPKRKVTNKMIAEAHQIYYDTTGEEISLGIASAILKILKKINGNV